MRKDRDIDREADEFAREAAAALKRIGFGGGENYCESQREKWLDLGREAYKRAVKPSEKDLEGPQP